MGFFDGKSVWTDPYALFFVQVIIIITLSRILHLVLVRLSQPRVISEIITGIILGKLPAPLYTTHSAFQGPVYLVTYQVFNRPQGSAHCI